MMMHLVHGMQQMNRIYVTERGFMAEKSYRVLFRQLSAGNELFIDIYSHYTCIYGVDYNCHYP